MDGTSDTIRRGGRTSARATPEASTRAAIRLEVTRVHEVHPVMEVHLELSAAVLRADPAGRVLQERLHLARRQAHEPLEPDRPGPRLLHADRRGELWPHADELREDLSARRVRDAAVDEVTREVRLDDVPAPRGNHCGAKCIMRRCG